MLQSCHPNLKRLGQITKTIQERRFSKLEKDDYEEYENYIERLCCIRQKIQEAVDNDNLCGEILQDLGDNVRRCGRTIDFNTQYSNRRPDTVFTLSEQANDVIKFYRSREREDKTGKTRMNHFVVEAFRNPYEVEFFRNRYYEFFLLSLYAGQEDRERRAKFSPSRDDRDRGEGLTIGDFYKQNVSECVRLSDIAINNDGTEQQLRDKLSTYLALIKQPGCFAPTWKETAMHMAYSTSTRSTCISRQVGAVIQGSDGYIVGAGWNDVGSGQIGCGYRHFQDVKHTRNEDLVLHPTGDDGFRRWLLRHKSADSDPFCFKDKYSEYLIRKKLKKVEKNAPENFGRLGGKEKKYLVEKLQKELNLKMMQYCRALHAEENAILQSAIRGGTGVRDGTIYTTTFPCELCAKKIYQAGIRKVVFTEPYPKSISMDVFFRDGIRQIEFEQFEGVKSPSYFRLFKATVDRKEFQVLQHIG